MASYTRIFSRNTGDTILAADFTTEFSALEDAFAASTGHKHNGSTGEGGYIPLIADSDAKNAVKTDQTNNEIEFGVEVGGAYTEQLKIVDGAILPTVDNDIDLGSATYEFKDLYLDGTANIDVLAADSATLTTADINGGTIDATVVGGTTPAAGSFTTLSSSGAATLASLTVTGGYVPGTITGDLLPTTDGLYDLGSATFEWQDLYVDGTAYIDSGNVDALTVNTSAGLPSGTTVGTLTLQNGQITDSGGSISFGNENLSTTGTFASGATTITGDVLPGADGLYDLGASGTEWQDLWIDGTANIDSLVADTADINAGTIDGTTIGASSAAAGTFTTFTSTGIDDNATGERLQIGDTNLNIGPSSGTALYGVYANNTTSGLTLSGDNTGTTGANLRLFGSTHATLADRFQLRHDTTDIVYYDATNLQLMPNGTANVGVQIGTTDTTLYNNTSGTGVFLKAGGVIEVARDGDTAVALNRMTDTGAILSFYQAGVYRGAVTVSSSEAYLADSTGQRTTPDHYETGVFFPTLAGTTTVGSGVYTNQSGRYTRIGQTVFFIVFLAWTSHTGTGNMKVVLTNLPTGYEGSDIIVSPSDISMASNASAIGRFRGVYGTYGEVEIYAQAGGSITGVAMDSSGTLRLSGFYHTNG